MRVRKVDFYDSDGKYSHRADIRFNNDGTAHRGDINRNTERLGKYWEWRLVGSASSGWDWRRGHIASL